MNSSKDVRYLKFLAIVAAGFEKNIDDLRDWVWSQTELVRWIVVDPKTWGNANPAGDLCNGATSEIALVVVDLQSFSGLSGLSVADTVTQPVVAVSARVDSAVKRLAVKYDGRVVVAARGRKGVEEIQDKLKELLSQLNVPDFPQIDLRFDYKDLGLMRTLTELRGIEFEPNHGRPILLPWLKLAIAKYFGTTGGARLRSVTGGWSGTPLFYLTVAGDGFYMKFFDRREKLRVETDRHICAKTDWLGDFAADVEFVAGLSKSGRGLAEAFPDESRRFPLCLRSASRGTADRVTLYDLYEGSKFEAVRDGVQAVMNVLRQVQPVFSRMSPLDNPSHRIEIAGGQTFFLNDRERQGIVQDSLYDLRRTLRQLCPDWGHHETVILNLVRTEYPDWLAEDTPLLIGHIHGDLNTRNCLFAVNDPADLRLIDLGGYRSDGFLIHDLSMLETSIKWAAMGVESVSGYDFGDLDTGLLSDARRIEYVAVAKGLEFSQDSLLDALPANCRSTDNAVARAYTLIASIRVRAKELSVPHDPQGKHYFAALLAWNLRCLKIPHIRRIKKALALYSSAQILDKFGYR